MFSDSIRWVVEPPVNMVRLAFTSCPHLPLKEGRAQSDQARIASALKAIRCLLGLSTTGAQKECPDRGSLSGQGDKPFGDEERMSVGITYVPAARNSVTGITSCAVKVGLLISGVPLWVGSADRRSLSELHGTRFCAHAPKPTMQRASVAKIATLNSASIMAPSNESGLPFEGFICLKGEIFPVTGNASDDHHSLVLLIGQLNDVPR